MEYTEKKTCGTCKEEKVLEQFFAKKNTPQGVEHICKDCRRKLTTDNEKKMLVLHAECCCSFIKSTKFSAHRNWCRDAMIRCVDTIKHRELISPEKLIPRLNREHYKSLDHIPVGVKKMRYAEFVDWLKIYISISQHLGMKDGLPIDDLKKRRKQKLIPVVNEAMRLTTSFYLKETPSHPIFKVAISEHVRDEKR